jgi:hypothetical protein
LATQNDLAVVVRLVLALLAVAAADLLGQPQTETPLLVAQVE